MFRSLTSLLIFSFSISVFARAPGSFSQLKTDLQKVSNRNLMEYVNGLIAAGSPSRMVGQPGHAKAVTYLQETIMKLDPKNSGKLIVSSTPAEIDVIKKFYQNDFDQKVEGKIPASHPEYQKWMKFTQYMKDLADSKKSHQVVNLSWEKSGLSDKTLIVTAHYDTISHDKNTYLVNEKEPMPGANYNATGVAIALALIKTLAQTDLNYSVRVVLLDWQGIGFHGSYLYAKELKNSGKNIIGVVNLEMLGQDSTFNDKTKKLGNMSVYTRDLGEEVTWTKKLIEHGSKVATKVTFEHKPNGFDNSDNFQFWGQGFKAATFSQNWEDDLNPKFYQTAQDTPETLNHETLWYSYQYVGGAVLGTLLDLTK